MLTAINGVDRGKGDEEAQVGLGVVEAVQAEPESREDGHGILPAVDQVREHVPRVVVTPDALQGTPDGRQGGKEAHKARMVRVAMVWVVPAVGIEAEEQVDILRSKVSVSRC
jgi:hypothetical protein